MKSIGEDILKKVGFSNTSPEDYLSKRVVLRDGRQAAIWEHKKTGHGILDNRFWEERNYYKKDYRSEFNAKVIGKTSPSEHFKMYRDLNKKQFKTFSSNLSRKTKFLEIGCSFGGILKQVTRAGVAACHGVEPNMEDAEFVLKSNKKVRIFNTAFEKAKLSSEYYDMIVGIEVLEHVISPKFFLKKCFNLLAKDGLIHLEVPNHANVLLSAYKEAGYRKFYYHKAHIHYFTKDSISLLCRECGFSGNVSSFLMYPFFNHVWWYQNHKPQSSAVSALATPIPTGRKTPVEKEVGMFYRRVEKEYETLINANMLGDCLIFQGKKL